MKHARLLLVPAVGLTVAAALLLPPAGAAPGTAATTCQGRPVTIVASAEVTKGTPGDDVVAMTPLGWTTFDALDGDDLVCLALGEPAGGRDARGPVGHLEAGPGDDVVVNGSALAPGAEMIIGLGGGSDSYTGNGVTERVYADSTVSAPDDVAPVGAQRDLVDTAGGTDLVWSSAPVGALNQDRLVLGPGEARVAYRGAMAPDGLLDVSASSDAHLDLPAPGAAEPLARGPLTVDNVAARSTVGGVDVLRWTGSFRAFSFGSHPGRWALPVSFRGSDAAESVTFADTAVGEVRLGGGDDDLTVDSYNGPLVLRSADGGEGADTAGIHARCRVLAIAVARYAACDEASTPFGGFEDVGGTNDVPGSQLTLLGSEGAERLYASGHRVTMRGRGGADELAVDDSVTSRVSAGRGADRVYASGDDVLVRGQAGGDRIVLGGSAGIRPRRPVPWRQVALGGAGPDLLRGTTDKRMDRLVGNRGRDRADGRAGRRDLCLAETTTRCELA